MPDETPSISAEPHRMLRQTLDRLTRVVASEGWADDLNPSQRTALSYLAQANRFSRSPSQVADYMSTTRGTVSQTLKALARKGLIEERRSELDRRSISYEVTPLGRAAFATSGELTVALEALEPNEAAALDERLRHLLRGILRRRAGRPFGICRTCTHHEARGDGGWCRLLREPLAPAETTQLCHEHAYAA